MRVDYIRAHALAVTERGQNAPDEKEGAEQIAAEPQRQVRLHTAPIAHLMPTLRPDVAKKMQINASPVTRLGQGTVIARVKRGQDIHLLPAGHPFLAERLDERAAEVTGKARVIVS